MKFRKQLLALLAPLLLVADAAKLGQKMLLSQVSTLTLRSDQMTRGRRLEPIPQLKCVGGDGKGLYEIDVMKCRNSGSDYDDEDISWTCTADLPKYFKLGSTDVLCEGYDSPDDKYILKGSCGVEYRLALTDAGYETYGSSFSRLGSQTGDYTSILFWPIFLSILVWILYSAYTNRNNPNARPRPRAGNGRPWFWGGGGNDDPPPPYTPRPPYKPSSSREGEQWRPGFWSGLAAGAAGGYLMNNAQSRERERTRTEYSGFGGGSSSSGFGAGSSSAGRHTSTGFGQTRRR